MIVTMQDFRTIPGLSRRAGYCSAGGRAWFAAHNLDWTEFVKHGLDESVIRATNDALGIALADWAVRRAAAAADHVPGAAKMIAPAIQKPEARISQSGNSAGKVD